MSELIFGEYASLDEESKGGEILQREKDGWERIEPG
jgi:hypothetical protein